VDFLRLYLAYSREVIDDAGKRIKTNKYNALQPEYSRCKGSLPPGVSG
jgi:hypothetical protein